jgi:ComF family protein
LKLINFFVEIHKNLLSVIYPNFCNGCKKLLLKNEKIICTKCVFQLPKTHHHRLTENEITRKFFGILPIEFGFSMLYFNKKGITQSLIHNLKYRNKQEIGTYLGNLYALELLGSNKMKSVDFIIPVPLHKKRLHERGYNQIISFCRALEENLSIPLLENVLIKTKNLKSQTSKSSQNRFENNKNAFAIKNYQDLESKHFLLVDDVFTTGATIESCAKELLKIPNSKISVLTIAYSQS